MATGHKEEMNSTTATVAAAAATAAAVPTTILKTSAKPIHPRTKRRPSVTFKLPIDNNDDDDNDCAEEEPGTAASPTLTTNDSPTAIEPTSTEVLNKKQKEQVTSLVPCDNHNEGADNNSTIVPVDDKIKALHISNDSTHTDEAITQAEGTIAQTLMTQPEAMNSIVLEIADVAVKPFVAKQTGAQAPPVAPAFIDEAHRQFSNPISYLGGPMLKTRNRHSISSILSLD